MKNNKNFFKAPSRILAGVLCLAVGASAQAYTYRVPVPGLVVQTAATISQVQVSSSTLNFGTVAVGQSSSEKLLTLSNSGSLAWSLNSTSVDSASYAISSNTCGTVTAGASCQVGVTFSPSTVGAQPGVLTLSTSAGPTTISLSGTGEGTAIASVTPGALSFSGEQGSTFAQQTVTVTNTGTGGSLSVGSPTEVYGTYFPLSNGCSSPLSAGQSCNLLVGFTPTGAGTYSDNLTVPTSYASYTVTLSGTSTSPAQAQASPSSVAFGAVTLGSTSAGKNIALSNVGQAPMSVGTLSATPADFAISGSTCGTTLAGGQSCVVTVTFTPSSTGSQNGTLTLDTGAGTQSVSLSGTGQPAPAQMQASPSSLAFGTVSKGTTSPAQQITVSNTGGSSMTLGIPSATPSVFAVSGTTCGSTLAPGDSCSVSVTFSPTAAGSQTGALSMATNGGNLTSALSGTGQLVGPSDPAWASVNLLLPFDTNTTDISSPSHGNLALAGSATVTSSTAQFGGGSLLLPVNNNGSSYGSMTDDSINYGSGTNVTVEFWMRPTAYASATTPQIAALVGQWPASATGQWMLTIDRNGRLQFYLTSYNNTTPFITTTSVVPLNQWSAVALVRNGATYSLYLNGSLIGSASYSGGVFGLPGTPVIVGNYGFSMSQSGWNASFSGAIDELRISGVARYTTNYTPATAAFPAQ